jgi:hypothetical protein
MLKLLILARLLSSFEGGGVLIFKSVATSILLPVLREALYCGVVWKTDLGLVGGWAVGL